MGNVCRQKGAGDILTITRGRIGEIIKVKNESSKKIISAKVIDSGTVEVIM